MKEVARTAVFVIPRLLFPKDRFAVRDIYFRKTADWKGASPRYTFAKEGGGCRIGSSGSGHRMTK